MRYLNDSQWAKEMLDLSVLQPRIAKPFELGDASVVNLKWLNSR